MYDVGFFASQQLVKFHPCISGPNRSLRQADLAQNVELSNLLIAPTVGDDTVASELQHSLFLVEDDVLATRLLISIVNQDNFHRSGNRTSSSLAALLPVLVQSS